MEYILSVDLGTTAIKVAIVSSEGRLLSTSTQEYSLLTPTTLAVELEVETYWQAFKAGVLQVLEASEVDTSAIRAIGISAQGETLILTGKDGQPLRNAIVWMDNRAQEEAEILTREFDKDETYKITGQVSIVPTWPATKLLWLSRNEPEVFSRINKILLIEDYFIFRLTHKYVAEGSLLCSTVYWDIIKKTWWKDMLDYLKVSNEQLPEIRESGEVVGAIIPEVAKELGLSPNTVVCTGALDQAAGTIGVGNVKPGIFSENTGAALAICATVDQPFVDPTGRMPCHYHAMPDTYMAHTFTTGGIVLKWYRDMFCQSEIDVGKLAGLDPYEVLSMEASKIAAGADGLVILPHLQGAMAPEDNPKAKGVFYGITLHHTKAHFARAIMESIACIVKRNIEVIEDLGIEVREIRCLGGGSKSPVWNQIKADLTGRPVVTMESEEAACLGAAIVAGVGTGIFRSIEDACDRMVKIKNRYEPNRNNDETYVKYYTNYVNLYDSLTGMFANARI